MVRMVLGPLIESISNSIGATIISTWKGVTYARRKGASPSNPVSEAQANIRARISAASKRWAGVLTGAQRAGWESYAQGLGSAADSKDYDKTGIRVIIPDNRKVMSGINAYLLLNCLSFSAGAKLMTQWTDDAPNGIDPPNPPTNLTCECCSALLPKHNCVRWTWDDPVNTVGGERIRLWGVSHQGGAHRQVIYNVPLGWEDLALCDVKGAHGQTFKFDQLPGMYLFQIDCVSADGQKSPPSNICQLNLPTYADDPCPGCPP